MTTLQDLIDIEEIKKLKARYFRAVDTFDLDGWLDIFTEDAVLIFDSAMTAPSTDEPEKTTYAGTFAGKANLKNWWNSSTGRIQSVHHGHMPEIDILSPTEARGVWAMEAIVENKDSRFHGFGHYWETYRKEAGRWQIATMRLTRLRWHHLTWQQSERRAAQS